MLRRKLLLHISASLVAIVTVAVYLPALSNGFVTWDDHLYVYENAHVLNAGPDLLRWAFTSFHAHNWHPITWLSHGLDALLWRLDPRGHHATNILLHTANTVLVMYLIAMLANAAQRRGEGPDTTGPAADALALLMPAGLLFGLHPVHVEPVAWISQRKELLSTMFYLLGLLSYGRYCAAARPGQRVSYLATLGLFICALLSKPMAVTFPLVLLLLDWHPFRRLQTVGDARRLVAEKVPFLVLGILSSAVTVLAQQRAINEAVSAPLAARLVNALVAYGEYLRHLLWPADLIPFYPRITEVSHTLLSMHYLVPIAVLAVFAMSIFRSRGRILRAAGAFLIITLLPVIGIVHVGGQGMADRYMYLPSVGPIIVLSAGVHRIWTHIARSSGPVILRKGFFLAACGICSALLAFATVQQIRHWRDGISLWSHELEVLSRRRIGAPGAFAVAYANRGKAFSERNDIRSALQDYSRAVAAQPSWYGAYEIRGEAYLRTGEYARAIEDLSRTIDLRPDLSAPYILRARAFVALQRHEDAIHDYTAAIEREPQRTELLYNRGNVHARLGSYEKAVEDYSQAILLSPQPHPDYYANRGKALARLGRMSEAEADIRRAGSTK